MNKKPLLLLSVAALGAVTLVGIAASTRFASLSGMVNVNAGEFSANVDAFTLVGEEYVGAVVGDGGNNVRVKFSGVGKDEDGLTIAANSYATFTNIDPLRSFESLSFTFSTQSTSRSLVTLFFSTQPLNMQDVFQGKYPDLYTIYGQTYGSNYSCMLPSDKTESYRYVLGVVDAIEKPLTVRSISFTTPCTVEPEAVPTGSVTDWSEDIKAGMIAMVGEALPALGHNAYVYSEDYYTGFDTVFYDMMAYSNYMMSIMNAGFAMNYYQQISEGEMGVIFQKKLLDDKVGSLIVTIGQRSSNVVPLTVRYTDTMSWMAADAGWPEESLRNNFSEDLVNALAPLEFEDASFSEMRLQDEFVTQVGYLITPAEKLTDQIIADWIAAMETKGWTVNANVYSSGCSYIFKNAEHPNWDVQLGIDASQASLLVSEAQMTNVFPVGAIRERFGEEVPNFPVEGRYIMQSGASAERIMFNAYDISYAEVETYLPLLKDAGYVVTSKGTSSFYVANPVTEVMLSVEKYSDYITFHFRTLSGSSMYQPESMEALAYNVVKSSGTYDPAAFDFSGLPALPDGGYIRAVTQLECRATVAAVFNADADWLALLTAGATVDPLTGSFVLAESYYGDKLVLISASVKDGYCLLTLGRLPQYVSVDYAAANAFIDDRLAGCCDGFENPVYIDATDAPFMIQDQTICFIDGTGDAALAALRAKLDADPRFVYSEVDDAYVAPISEYSSIAYSFYYDADFYPALTRLTVDSYSYSTARNYVTYDALPSQTKAYLGRFPELLSTREDYVNTTVPISDSDGADYCMMIVRNDYDFDTYAKSLIAAGYTFRAGCYVYEDGNAFYSISDGFAITMNGQFRAITFKYYPMLAQGELATYLGAKTMSLLPDSFDTDPFFSYRSYSKTSFRWCAPISYDLTGLAEKMVAKGWTVTQDTPNNKTFTRVDALDGSLMNLRVRDYGGYYLFTLESVTYDFDFTPTRIGLLESGINPYYVEALMGATLPDDGSIGYRLSNDGSSDALDMLVVGSDVDAYAEKLQGEGYFISASSDGFRAYSKDKAVDYEVTYYGAECYSVRVNASGYGSDLLVLQNDDFTAYAASKGFDGADFNIDCDVSIFGWDFYYADEDMLIMRFNANIEADSLVEYFTSRGYELIDENFVRSDGNYTYTINVDDFVTLVIVRR